MNIMSTHGGFAWLASCWASVSARCMPSTEGAAKAPAGSSMATACHERDMVGALSEKGSELCVDRSRHVRGPLGEP